MAGPGASNTTLRLLLVIMHVTASLCCYKRLVYHGQFPLLYIDDCSSNFDLGLLIGSTFSSMIKGRLRDSAAFQRVQSYCGTNWGRELLVALKGLHRETYPTYFAELQGLAAGSGVPFDQIFMLNLRQEILAASESPDTVQRWLQSRQAAAGAAAGGAAVSGSGGDGADALFDGVGGPKGQDRGHQSIITPRVPHSEDKRGGGVSHRSDQPGQLGTASQPGTEGRNDRSAETASLVTDDGSSSASRDGVGHGTEAVRAQGTVVESEDDDGSAAESAAAAAAAGGGAGGEWVDPATVDACSDVAVRLVDGDDPSAAPAVLLVGHNEDMTNDTLGRMYYIRASMPGRSSWFALTYAGELASTAFGANTAGVAFTLNALYPKDALLPGLGRNFLSRRLLDARDVGEALRVLTAGDQATGRSVNLMSTREPLGVWNVEIGPGGSYDIIELANNDWYFHANAYIRLPQSQKVDNSSIHRQARASQYDLPRTPAAVLALLGDTQDTEFPIYRVGDYGGLVYTLCTALYDLRGRTLTVYRGNPQLGVVGSVLNLDSLLPRGGWGGEVDPDEDAQAV